MWKVVLYFHKSSTNNFKEWFSVVGVFFRFRMRIILICWFFKNFNRFEKICVITQLVLIGSVVQPFYFVPPKSWYFLLNSDLQLCCLCLETEICNSIKKTCIYLKLESENALTILLVFPFGLTQESETRIYIKQPHALSKLTPTLVYEQY